jgi:hypothetical protein
MCTGKVRREGEDLCPLNGSRARMDSHDEYTYVHTDVWPDVRRLAAKLRNARSRHVRHEGRRSAERYHRDRIWPSDLTSD